MHVHIQYNTVPESPSPSTAEVETTATSSIISLFQSDSESDQSTDSPPSPKQPCIEQEQKVSVINIDVPYLAKRRGSLTEHEKYNLYCYHFTLILITSFHVKVVVASYTVFEKVQLVDLQLAREWWVLSCCVLFARSIDIRKGKGVLVADSIY